MREPAVFALGVVVGFILRQAARLFGPAGARGAARALACCCRGPLAELRDGVLFAGEWAAAGRAATLAVNKLAAQATREQAGR